MRNAKALLIDPIGQSITEYTLTSNPSDDWREIAKMLQCDYIERVKLNANENLWIDEEGRLTNPNPRGYFSLFGQVFAGKGLILGTDGEDTVSTKLTPEMVQEEVLYHRAQDLSDEVKEPHMEFITDPDAIAAILGGDAHLQDKDG